MTLTPLCPKCNKRMYIGKSMTGPQWYCPSYASCGGRINKVEAKEEEEIKDEGKN